MPLSGEVPTAPEDMLNSLMSYNLCRTLKVRIIIILSCFNSLPLREFMDQASHDILSAVQLTTHGCSLN